MCSSYKNPASLIQLSLETFCKFVNDEYIKPAFPVTHPPKYVVHFRDDIYLPETIAEKLLAAFCEKEILNCITATMFDPKTSRLR